MKKSLNSKHKFICVKCIYSTNSKKDYTKHCITKKHKKSLTKDKKNTSVEFTCPYCSKLYKFRSGLSRHKKSCEIITYMNLENDNNDNKLSHNDNNKSPTDKHVLNDIFTKQQKQGIIIYYENQ